MKRPPLSMTETQATSLDRRLGPFDAAAIIVSNVIGGGILFTPKSHKRSIVALPPHGGRAARSPLKGRWLHELGAAARAGGGSLSPGAYGPLRLPKVEASLRV